MYLSFIVVMPLAGMAHLQVVRWSVRITPDVLVPIHVDVEFTYIPI